MRASRVLLARLLLVGLVGAGSLRQVPRPLPPRVRRGRGTDAHSMDAWLIRKPSASAGGSADGSPRKRARPATQQRTLSGSSFAECPVCGRLVALALLQADHMFSATCVPVGDEPEGRMGGAAPARGSRAAWWAPEEQKRLRDAQPLTPSWWEAPSRRPRNEAQQPLNRAEAQVQKAQKAQEQLRARVLDPSHDTDLVAGAAGTKDWLPKTAICDVPGCMH